MSKSKVTPAAAPAATPLFALTAKGAKIAAGETRVVTLQGAVAKPGQSWRSASGLNQLASNTRQLSAVELANLGQFTEQQARGIFAATIPPHASATPASRWKKWVKDGLIAPVAAE